MEYLTFRRFHSLLTPPRLVCTMHVLLLDIQPFHEFLHVNSTGLHLSGQLLQRLGLTNIMRVLRLTTNLLPRRFHRRLSIEVRLKTSARTLMHLRFEWKGVTGITVEPTRIPALRKNIRINKFKQCCGTGAGFLSSWNQS